MSQRALQLIIALLTFLILGFGFVRLVHAATVCQIFNGCIATSTLPGYGQILIGGKNGEYEFIASSTLGGSGSSAVTSVFGRTGAVTAHSGDYTTSQVTEGTNLYYTAARALADFIANLSATTSVSSITTLPNLSLPYTQLTGTPNLSQYLTLAAWYATTTDQLKEGTTNLYFTNARADARFITDLAGTSSVSSITALPNLSLPYSQLSGTPFIPSFPLSASNGGTGSTTLSGILKGNGTGGVQTAVGDSDYQKPISLTTSGTSGAASFTGDTLNIPQYQAAGTYLSAYDAFTHPAYGGSATTSLITAGGGLISQASSTFTGTVSFAGNLNIGSNIVYGNSFGSGDYLQMNGASGYTLLNGNNGWGINLQADYTRLVGGGEGNTELEWSSDTGLSRLSAGVLALGNGTYQDSSGGFIAASSTLSHLTVGTLSGFVGAAGGLLYQIASSSLDLPNSALQNSSLTVNGTGIALGGSGTITAASSTLLSDSNTFSGTDNFSGTLKIGGTSLSLPVSVANGGTAASDALTALENLGALSNGRIAITSSTTVSNSDAGYTLALGGSAFYPLDFNAPSGYNSNFMALVVNEDSTRGKSIYISGGTSFILWPNQSVLVYNQNNVWQVLGKSRWKTPYVHTGPTFYVDPLLGSDSNDCLASGSGACATINQAVDYIIQNQLDLYAEGAPQATVQLADGEYGYRLHLPGPFTGQAGNATVVIQGDAANPQNVVWDNADDTTNSPCIAMFDDAKLEIKDMELACPNGDISVTSGATLRLEQGIYFGTTTNAQMITSDGGGIYDDQPYYINGNSPYHLIVQTNGFYVFDGNGSSTTTQPVTFTDFVIGQGNSTIGLGLYATSSGAVTGTQFYMDTNAVLSTAGSPFAVVPGTTPGAYYTGAQPASGRAYAIAEGGTNETSQTTNGVNYFDGTGITSGSELTFDGTNFANTGNVSANGNLIENTNNTPIKGKLVGGTLSNLLLLDSGNYLTVGGSGMNSVILSDGYGTQAQVTNGVLFLSETHAGANSTITTSAGNLEITSSGGLVGIGTSTPATALDIRAPGTAAAQEAYFGKVCAGSTSYFGLAIGNSGASDCNHYDVMGDGTNLYLNAAPGGGITLGSANSQTMNVNSTSVGIGTTSPWANLSIFTGSDYASHAPSTLFAIGSTTAGTATSTLFAVTSAGQVGIGIANPSNALQIYSTTNANIVQQGDGVTTAATQNDYITSASAANYQFNKARGSLSSPTIVALNDNLGQFTFRGYDGSTFRSAAAIAAVVDNTPASSQMYGELQFDTNNGGTGAGLKMVLTSTGRLGIGTSTPFAGLGVDVVTGSAATSTITDGSSVHPSCLQLYSPNGTAYAVYVSNSGSLTTVSGACQ